MNIKLEILNIIKEEGINASFSDTFLDNGWKELNIDSLSTFSIITNIEDKYNITFSNEDLDSISTPAKLVTLVELKINKGKI